MCADGVVALPVPYGRLSAPILGRFDGGVVCFRVYLEQPVRALKLTKPALQLLVVHVLKRSEQLLASHRLVLLNPSQQLGLSAPFILSFSLGFSMRDFQRASIVC
jgi:hypothetical protein